MTAARVYGAHFPFLRNSLQYALKNMALPFDQAIDYVVEEQNLLQRDQVGRAISFTALATVALEFDYLRAFGAQLGTSDPLSQLHREHCGDANAAAVSIGASEDREAFLRDIGTLRAALKMD